jgi:hypothetical protein
MHPEDVRELVADEFSQLERLVGERAELGVKGLELAETDVYVSLTVATSAAAAVPPEVLMNLGAGKTLLLPGTPGQGARAVVFNLPQSVPILGETTARELVLRLGCNGYNGRPPLAQLMRPDDRTAPLPDDEWPREPAGQGIVQAHPRYKRKFFCRPGLREFHELDQHADTPWDAIRESSTLGWIVVSLLGDLQTRWKLL